MSNTVTSAEPIARTPVRGPQGEVLCAGSWALYGFASTKTANVGTTLPDSQPRLSPRPAFREVFLAPEDNGPPVALW